MKASQQVRIDAAAARALAEWKSLFGTDVCAQAKRLAAQAGCPATVTLAHYRSAAKTALQTLAAAISGEHGADGQHEAA